MACLIIEPQMTSSSSRSSARSSTVSTTWSNVFSSRDALASTADTGAALAEDADERPVVATGAGALGRTRDREGVTRTKSS